MFETHGPERKRSVTRFASFEYREPSLAVTNASGYAILPLIFEAHTTQMQMCFFGRRQSSRPTEIRNGPPFCCLLFNTDNKYHSNGCGRVATARIDELVFALNVHARHPRDQKISTSCV